MRFPLSLPALLVAALVSASTAAAREEANPGAEWPCFHGPGRTNRSAETGQLDSWPEEGPALEWTAAGLGHGFSSVSVAGGRIFTAGMADEVTYVVALDLAGKILWTRPNGRSWRAGAEQPWARPHAGSRGTPTVDGDSVYHLSDSGSLTCFDPATGETRWRVEIAETFAAGKTEYGYSESVLVLGDRLLCTPGGREGYMAALDKRTGRTLWTCRGITDAIGYSSPVPAVIGGVEQVVTLTASHVLAVAVEDGRALWKWPFANQRDNNIADPVVRGELVFVSSGYGRGSALLRPTRGEDGSFSVEAVWETAKLDNHHGGVVLHEGFLYGAGHEARGWFCLEFETGRERWNAPGKGSLTYADGRFYCLDEKGVMTLVVASPEGWKPAGTFRVPRGGTGLFWAHPVVCGGRLYVRHSDNLHAFRVAE